MKQSEKMWNVQECAEYVGLAPITIRRYIRKKQIPYHIVGERLIKFYPEEIKKWKDKF